MPMTSFSWTFDSAAEGTRIAISGELTETGNYRALLGEVKNDVVFDLSGVDRINSSGVREWMRFLRELKTAGRRFAFERCSSAVVAQLNMMSSFSESGEVRSVLAPYVCSACGAHDDKLVDLGPKTPTELDLTLSCPKCSTPMEFDDLPEHYFAFQRQG
jgi:anti-anti-sigma regulatory factor